MADIVQQLRLVLGSPEVKILAQLVIVGWMVAVSIMDHLTGRIPNWTTAPVFLGVGVLRLVVATGLVPGVAPSRLSLAFMLVAWVILFILWMLNFIGGGDTKFLMALFALFPGMEFTFVLALILLVIMVPILLLEWRGTSLRAAGRGLRSRLLTGQVLPTQEELQEKGRRYIWTYAIPAIVYTVFYW